MEQERILHLMRGGRVPHALLIAGPVGSGKKALARRAAALWCMDVDDAAKLSACANYYELAGDKVGVDAVRDLIGQTAVQGFNGGRRAFVLTDAHRMNVQSQNALLKTLEEPPAGTILILTGNESGLLPTIRSRCTTFRLGAAAIGAIADALAQTGVGAEVAMEAARLSGGVPGLAEKISLARSQSILDGAADCLSEALFGVLPFSQMAALLATPREETGARSAKEEKKKPDMENAEQITFFWQSLLGDALLISVGGAQPRASMHAALSEKIARRFTISEIQGMIKNTIETEKQLRMNANPAQTMDAALVLLHDKEITSWQR